MIRTTESYLIESLDEAIYLLRDYARSQNITDGDLKPLTNLIEQCEHLSREQPAPEPIRMVHQFACTGGTLICKLLATLPNVFLLSEIDPLSKISLNYSGSPQFAPTDLLYGMRFALRNADDCGIVRVFLASLKELYSYTNELGRYLVLRDHSHSHFCANADIENRPTLREMVQPVLPTRSIVTVRHPLDSFLSLDNNGWRHFQPFTLEEYARRYVLFLERHDDVAIVRYEDLTNSPSYVIQNICKILDLPFVEGSENLISIVKMSGDSGRSASTIEPRSRRAIPEWVMDQIGASSCYEKLCHSLGYISIP